MKKLTAYTIDERGDVDVLEQYLPEGPLNAGDILFQQRLLFDRATRSCSFPIVNIGFTKPTPELLAHLAGRML